MNNHNSIIEESKLLTSQQLFEKSKSLIQESKSVNEISFLYLIFAGNKYCSGPPSPTENLYDLVINEFVEIINSENIVEYVKNTKHYLIETKQNLLSSMILYCFHNDRELFLENEINHDHSNIIIDLLKENYNNERGKIALLLSRIDRIKETELKHQLSIIAYNTGYIENLDFLSEYYIPKIKDLIDPIYYFIIKSSTNHIDDILVSFDKKRYIEKIELLEISKDIKSQDILLLLEVMIHIYTVKKFYCDEFITLLKNDNNIMSKYYHLYDNVKKLCSQNLYHHILDKLIQLRFIDEKTIVNICFNGTCNDEYLLTYVKKIISDYSLIPDIKIELERLKRENNIMIKYIKSQPDGELFLSTSLTSHFIPEDKKHIKWA